MKLIGFTGTMGSGKSTAIEALTRNTGLKVENVKFAQPLYDMQEMIYRRISSVVKRDPNFKKDRKLLQWLGTDWGRDTISKTLWVDLWRHEANAKDGPETLIVCDDVRFDNEGAIIKEMGGMIIKLIRPDGQADGGKGILGHSSEGGISLDYVDAIIENVGSKSDLEAQVLSLYHSFDLN